MLANLRLAMIGEMPRTPPPSQNVPSVKRAGSLLAPATSGHSPQSRILPSDLYTPGAVAFFEITEATDMASAAPRACAFRDIRVLDHPLNSQPISFNEFVCETESELREAYRRYLAEFHYEKETMNSEEPVDQGTTGTDQVIALSQVCPELPPGDPQWAEVFEEIYRLHNPALPVRLPVLMDKYRNMETAWWNGLAFKYGFGSSGVASSNENSSDNAPSNEDGSAVAIAAPESFGTGSPSTHDSATTQTKESQGADEDRPWRKTPRGCRAGTKRVKPHNRKWW